MCVRVRTLQHLRLHGDTQGKGPQMGSGGQLQDLRVSHFQSKPLPRTVDPIPRRCKPPSSSGLGPPSWPQASSRLSGLSLPTASLEVFGGDAVSPAPGSRVGLAREHSGHARASHQRLEAGGPRARRTQASDGARAEPHPGPRPLTTGMPDNNGRPSGGPQGQRLCFWF